jgi:ADP-heptose:LPS heptosyltransferase
MKYVISVVCHNNLEYTKKCIESVRRRSDPGQYHLIVTDNASRDGTREWLRDNNGYDELVINKTNLGFNQPHNNAYGRTQHVGAAYFVVLNNDVTVCDRWLTSMEAPFLTDDKMAITGIAGACSHLTAEGTGIPSDRLDYIEASCMMVKRSHFKTLFSEELKFAYYEDAWLSLEARERGLHIATVSIPVRHGGVKTSSFIKEDIRGYTLRNKHVFLNRWGHYLKTRRFDHEEAVPVPKHGRILVKRDGAIGDVILTCPVIRELKRLYPESRVVVETACPQVFTGNPYVYSVVPCGHPLTDFDQIIDLNLSYEKRPGIHPITAYSDQAGIKVKDWSLDLSCNDSYRLNWDYVVIHTGLTAWGGRNWPSRNFAQISNRIREMGIKTVTVGTNATPMIETDNDLRSRLDFEQLKSVIKYAKGFVGIDSMPMHVAQAFGVPLVAVFGCVLPELRLLPDEKFVGVNLPQLGCIGCHHWHKAPRTQTSCVRDREVCMEDLSVDAVWERVEKMLVPKPAPPTLA